MAKSYCKGVWEICAKHLLLNFLEWIHTKPVSWCHFQPIKGMSSTNRISVHIFFWVLEEKNELSSSQILYNTLEKYLSPPIYKNIYFIHIKFNSIYKREWLLIHLVRPTTKEKKLHSIIQIHMRLYLFKIKDQSKCVHK